MPRPSPSPQSPQSRPLRDQAARDLIESALDRNVLVEAGAGSGKTESLARRMGAGIATGRYAVEHMAAVTFTRKAAAELRGRFQLDLERRLRTAAEPGARQRLEGALGRLEQLFAGTIHAFCAHLLRERPVEAGVAPGFTELDDVEDFQQRQAAWRAFWERERARGARRLGELADAGLTPADLDPAFAIVCRFPEVAFPAGSGRPPALGPARRALDRFWAALEPLLPEPIPPGTTCKLLQRVRGLAGRRRVGRLDHPAELAETLASWATAPAPTLKWWGDRATARRAGALAAAFAQDTAAPFGAAWRQYRYRLALDCLDDARREAAAARRQAVVLNYEDLLQLAARLLRERADVRAALQTRFRWLFVDEFQDTDPIQAEVIGLLGAAPDSRSPADWTRVPLRPGALFVVGDPKQSIYRFRRADIETYGRMRARIEATGGAVVTLTTSFRSVPALSDWANRVFPDLFPRRATPQQPAFDRLDPVREAGDPRRTGVRQLVIPASVPEADVTHADADLIARFIRAEVDAGRRGWGDFLVLTLRKGSLATYAQALDRLEIPVEVSGAGGFAESGAVGTLADLLRALADPGDGPALVGVLRGPLFGLSDRALFAHRQAGSPFLVTIPLGDDATGPVADALRALQAMYRWTRELPAPAAVERVLEATGWLADGAAAGAGGAEAGHLLHAVDRVRRIVETGGTLFDAVEALDADLEASDVEAVPLESGRRDVVRLMNLHKAKGLEGRVVVLADPLQGLADRVDVRIARDGPGAQGYFPIVRPNEERPWIRLVLAEPPDWVEHEATERTYLQAERHRLLYVAATRAQDLLVVSCWAGTGGRARPWETFAAHLDAVPVLKVPAAVALPAAARRPTLAARERATATREARLAALRTPSWRVESVTATAHRAGPAGEPLQPGRTREPDTGMAWGRLVHALLEHAVRSTGCDRAHLERVARWLTVDDAELRRVVPDALDTVERVLTADLWQRARAAAELHAEVPVAVRLDGEAGGPPRVLHGVIDLAFRGPDGWELVDYKTDQADVATLAAQYGDQVRQYAAQWSALTGEPVARASVYAVRAQTASDNLLEA
jgi:ATP-dependent helicase/nuclease subunit A